VISARTVIQIRECDIDQRQTQLDFHVWFTNGKPLIKKLVCGITCKENTGRLVSGGGANELQMPTKKLNT